MSEKVGFIGLGNIGKPMAVNLAAQDFSLKVFDVAEKPRQSLAKRGAEVAEHMGDFADCSVVGVCVRNDQDVEDLLYGEQGLLNALQADSIIAIHCTVTRDNVLRWAADAQKAGVHLIDAPISGGADGAASATLVYMLGGDDAIIERFCKVFAATGKSFIHAGETGAGIVLKLANNLMTYSALSAISEANALLADAGLELDKLIQVGQNNGVVTEQMQKFISNREALAAACSDEDMEAIFSPFAGLAEKDLHHALELAEQQNTQLPNTKQLAGTIRDVFLKQGAAKTQA